MTEENLRQVLLTSFEYSYEHDDWVKPLSEAMSGITLEQALWRPGGGFDGHLRHRSASRSLERKYRRAYTFRR